MTLTQGSPSHRMAIRWLQLIYTENWRVLFPYYYYYSPKRPVLAVTHKSRSDHSPRPNVSTGTLEAVIPSTRVRSLMLRPGTHAVPVCFALLPATAIRASILEIETTAADLLPGSRPCLAGWVGSGDCSRCSCCCAQTRSPTAPSSWCSSSQSSSSRTRLLLARWHLLHLIHSQSFTDSSLFASFPRFPLLRPYLDRLLFQCLNPHTLSRGWRGKFHLYDTAPPLLPPLTLARKQRQRLIEPKEESGNYCEQQLMGTDNYCPRQQRMSRVCRCWLRTWFELMPPPIFTTH